MVVNSEHKFVFIHVPKTAGTSIMEALGSINGDLKWPVSSFTKHETYTEWKGKLVRRFLIYLITHPWDGFRAYNQLKEMTSYTVYCVYRDPYDRAASLFRYLKKIGRLDVAINYSDFLAELNLGSGRFAGLHSLKAQADFVDGVDARSLKIIPMSEVVETGKINVCGIEVILPFRNSTSKENKEDIVDDVAKSFVEKIYDKDF